MSIEAMKQALKFCEEIGDLRGPYPFVNETSIVSDSRKVLTALRQAIAEAERHVSYVCPNCHWSLEKQVRTHTLEDVKKIESKWSGLTEDDLASCKSDEFVVFAKTIEAKLKEKNT